MKFPQHGGKACRECQNYSPILVFTVRVRLKTVSHVWYVRIDATDERTEIYTSFFLAFAYFPSKSKMALRKSSVI